MRRDLIIVIGGQGCGKSVWTKAWAAPKARLFVSDPLGSFPNVDFLAEPEEWWPNVRDGHAKTFRFGTYIKEELPFFGHAAYAVGDCALVIEECALMFERGVDLDEWAKRLVFMGRHRSVDLVLVAQRAVKVPLDVRSQASRIVSFRQTDPNDLRAVSETIGGDFEDEIRTLPDLSCVDWDRGNVSRYAVKP